MRRTAGILLSLTMALTLAAPAAAAGSTFTDVPQSHWAYAYVEEMTQAGVVGGVGDGKFDPGRAVSTAEFAVMLANAFCSQALAQAAPAETDWWEPYVETIRACGLLTDTSMGFAYEEQGGWDPAVVEAPLTRYDMAQIMYNTAVYAGLDLPTDGQREAAQRAIGDYGSIPEDYESAVVAMYALGYLSGVNADGDFGGGSAMDRAAVCVVMCSLLGRKVTAEAPEQPEEPSKGEGTAGSASVEETEPPAEEAGTEPGDTVALYEREVFDLVNQIREENGLEPFVYNETLADTARAHSQDMIDRAFFDHTNPDGDDPFDRMEANGVTYWMAAENIAAGYTTPEAVVEGWMNSPGHRANILSDCEELGVGLALGGSMGYYWTQCFATLR